MGRKLIIETDKLINLIDKYIIEECGGTPSKLKIPALADYVRRNGYPNLNDNIIRRNDEARKYINSLKETEEIKFNNIAITYHTLNVDKFLETNSSKNSLKTALVERDNYYRNIAMATTFYKDLSSKHEKKIAELETIIKELQLKLDTTYLQQLNTLDKVDTIKKSSKELEIENKLLHDIIDTYVYPEIANELLKKSGLLKNTGNFIDVKKLEKEIVSPSTKIQAKNKVIQGLFNSLD